MPRRRPWSPLVLVLASLFWTGCQADTCSSLCLRLSRRLDTCMEEWPVEWERLDVQNRAEFQQSCEQQWSSVRADLEPREFSDALDQCEEGLDELERMRVDGTSCDELRTLYLEE